MNLLETTSVICPYCGEQIDLSIDCSIPHQQYIEDCQVCCRPISVTVDIDGHGLPAVTLAREDD